MVIAITFIAISIRTNALFPGRGEPVEVVVCSAARGCSGGLSSGCMSCGARCTPTSRPGIRQRARRRTRGSSARGADTRALAAGNSGTGSGCKVRDGSPGPDRRGVPVAGSRHITAGPGCGGEPWDCAPSRVQAASPAAKGTACSLWADGRPCVAPMHHDGRGGRVVKWHGCANHDWHVACSMNRALPSGRSRGGAAGMFGTFSGFTLARGGVACSTPTATPA